MRRFALGAAALVLAFGLAARCPAAATYYVDPEKGTADGDGSEAKPWRTLEEVIRTGALRKVEPGDTVLLKSGYHGSVTLSGKNSDFITIAADKGARAKVSRLEITSGEKWRVRGLIVSPSFAEKPYKGTMVVFGEGGPSSDLVIEDCFIYTELDSSGWDAKKWMSVNSGVTMGRHGKHLVLRNNYILNTRFGIALCAEQSLCEGNVVHNFSADGIRVTRDDLTVQFNVIKNNFVSASDGDENHDDGIQCFLFNKGTGTVRRAKVVGNIIINREDDRQKWHNPLQAIGFFDGPLIDFVVTDNVVCVDMWHGVSLFDATGCRIERNVCWTRWHSRREPWVQLSSKGKGEVKNNVVRDNYACSFEIDSKNVTAENNKRSNAHIYEQSLARLYKVICEKFGTIHPTARVPRLLPQR